MPNLLQSSQAKTTEAPGYYTDYLTGLARSATGMMPGGACAPQYVGAQPLQQKAFQTVCQNLGAYQPAVATGQQLLGQAGGQDITGAAAPFISQAATSGGLGAAQPYLSAAAGRSPADLAREYMNPFVQSAVQSMSDIAQRNIRQNLSPQAVAAAVGSGQFGSQRGAQVLGQVQAQAQQDLNNQIAQMLTSGYGQGLQAAGQQQALMGQLGQTAGGLGQQQAALLGQLGQTAGGLAAQEAAARQQAGLGMGTLAQQAAGMNLACINALSTLGAQQQTIAQNQQMFPLTTLSNLAGIMQGQAIPTGTRTQLCMSPLSAIAAIGAGGLGVIRNLPQIRQAIGSLFPAATDQTSDWSGGATPPPPAPPAGGEACGCYCCCLNLVPPVARGGLIKSKSSTGCSSTMHKGALPFKKG